MCVNVSRAPNNPPFTSKEMQRYLFVLKEFRTLHHSPSASVFSLIETGFFFVSSIFETMYLV